MEYIGATFPLALEPPRIFVFRGHGLYWEDYHHN